jgi:hypothetical protein
MNRLVLVVAIGLGISGAAVAVAHYASRHDTETVACALGSNC